MLPQKSSSVSLQLRQPRRRLDCGQLRWEPAITALDWLFTPTPRLEEQMHLEPLQASTTFYRGFTLPRRRSSGFGSNPCDLRRFHTSALIACGHLLSLRVPCSYPRHRGALPGSLFKTNDAHLSARISLSLSSFGLFELPSTGSFQRSLTVLFAIGLKTCLRLEVIVPRIHTQFPMCATQDISTATPVPVRGYHPLWHRVPADFSSWSSA